MVIKNLTLTNFRNYALETFTFSEGLNVLTGRNAQGKTNCAEAVYHATRELLTRPTRPDLLIVMPDSGVTGAIQAILELGVHVPEELRLVLHRNLGLEYFCSLPADYWDVDLETVSNEFIEEIMGATSSTRRKDPLS